MQNKAKRLLSLFLSVLMVVSIVPTSAFAAGDGGSITYYVESGVDGTLADGTETNPYLSIKDAISAATAADASDLTVLLKSDVGSTQRIDFNTSYPITITSSGETRSIQFTGTESIGSQSGFLQVSCEGTEVTFNNVNLMGNTGNYDGRVIHVSNGATVNLIDATVTGGKVNVSSNALGGAGILVAKGGTLNASGATSISGNTCIGSGAGIYVDDGGYAYLTDSTSVTGNISDGAGSGIYVAGQHEDPNAGLFLSDSVEVSGNGKNATNVCGGVYLDDGANAQVKDSVKISDNFKSNLYLVGDATLDISGATTSADIKVSTDNDYNYRLVSNAVNGYAIQPTVDGDESGWTAESADFVVRYKVINGVEGLYLTYPSVHMIFSDVDTLEKIEANVINGEVLDFMENVVPGTTSTEVAEDAADGHRAGNPTTMTVPDILSIDTKGNVEDLVVTLTADSNEYRMPTKDVISITSNGTNIPFEYVTNYTDGVATITIKREDIDNLTAPVVFKVSAEKYHTLTISAQGPLYSLVSSITGLSASGYNFSLMTEKTDDTHLAYKASQDGEPVKGLQVVMYDSETGAEYKTDTTDDDGVVVFDVEVGKNYYPIIKYDTDFRVIKRDVIDVALSTLAGQTLLPDATKSGNLNLEYDASARTSKISNVTSDSTVVYWVNENQDTLYFYTNEPMVDDTTTAIFTSGTDTKKMASDANVYGTLSVVELEGYTFLGWYTDPVDGEKIESTTLYTTGVNTKLYAHWRANTDTTYTVKHWVEKVDGININDEGEVADGETKVVDGVTYYLYTQTTNTGTSDTTKDITADILSTMTDAKGIYTWWERAGFNSTADSEENCKITADGNAIFNVIYDRKNVKLSFTNKGAGTAVPGADQVFDDKTVKFGAKIGVLPEPSLEGYSFTNWYVADEDNNIVVPNKSLTATDVCYFLNDTKLVAQWNANVSTGWALKVMTQDIERDANGMAFGSDNYTVYKTVYIDKDELGMTGTTDTTLTIDIADIADLEFEGFTYSGYSATENGTLTEDTDSFDIYIKPAGDGEVYLFFTRDTVDVACKDGDGKIVETGSLIYGGDFTGHLLANIVHDGKDFDGWVDGDSADAKAVTSTTSANSYVVAGNKVILNPVLNSRMYTLTYVAGRNIGSYSKTTFHPSTGSDIDVDRSPSVDGGYVDGKDVVYGLKLGTMPTASRPGYTFKGWYLEGNGGTAKEAFIPTDEVKVDENTILGTDNIIISNEDKSKEETKVLYAGYEPHVYHLKLEAGVDAEGNPATIEKDVVDVTFNQNVGELPVPAKKGYTFVGWSTDETEMKTITANTHWEKAYTNGTTIKLYAHYIVNSYKYTFNMNDSLGTTKGSLLDLSVIYGDQVYDGAYGEDASLSVVAVRPGYNFRGWSTTKDGEILTADTIVSVPEDRVLYAVWEPKVYNVKLMLKGATIADLNDNWNISSGLYHKDAVYNSDEDSWTIPVEFDSVIFNEQGHNPNGTLPSGTKVNTEYFGYKYTTHNFADLDALRDSHGLVKRIPAYTDYADENGITLTMVMEPYFIFHNTDANAKWMDTTLNVIDNKVTVLRSDMTKMPEMSKEGYKFLGWMSEDSKAQMEYDRDYGTLGNYDKYIISFDELDSVERPQEFYPVFSGYVTLDAGEGATVEGTNKQVELISAKDININIKGVKAGYNFVKWVDVDGKDIDWSKIISDDVPVTLHAIYTPIININPDNPTEPVTPPARPDYKDITFDGNGVDFVDKDSDEFTVNQNNLKKMPELKDRPGWTFVGWFVDDKQVSYEDIIKSDVPLHVVAKWSRNMAPINMTIVGGHAKFELEEKYPTLVSTSITPILTDSTHLVYSVVVTNAKTGESVGVSGYEDGHWEFVMPEEGVNITTNIIPLTGKYFVTLDHSKKLVAGYPDKTFRGDNKITRAEAAQILYNALTPEAKMNATPREFPDVKNSNSWYYKAVTTLGGLGAIAGFPDGEFKPNREITRAEFVTMCVNFLDKQVEPGNNPFKDIKGTEWYANNVLIASKMGWVAGYSNGTFGPERNILRGEAVCMLNRMLERRPDRNFINAHMSEINIYKDVPQTKWYFYEVCEANVAHNYEKSEEGTETWKAFEVTEEIVNAGKKFVEIASVALGV